MATSSKQYPGSGVTIAYFVFRRYWKSSLIWGAFFGVTVVSSALGFATAYPTEASRQLLAASFGNNLGLTAIIGIPHALNTVGGFTMWRSLGFITLFGAVWGLLFSTNIFRGEEEAGRIELLRSGQVTARQTAANLFLGEGLVLGLLYVIVAALTLAVGHAASVAFPLENSLFFAFCLLLSIMEFFVIGALVSQLVGIRSQAAAASAVVFGVFFALRSAGDTTSATWLALISPVGWIEKLQPLTNPQPVWLIPIFAFILVIGGGTLWIAGNRDLGASVIPSKDTAKARLYLLGSAFGITLRQNITGLLGWLVGLSLFTMAFSSIAKAAGTAFGSSPELAKALGKITTSGAQILGSTVFFGVVFLIATTILLVFVTTYVAGFREEEASGRLDNLLVQPLSRETWLDGTAAIGIVTIFIYCFVVGLVAWFAASLQQTGIAGSTLVHAGMNMAGPALFLLGFGVLSFSLIPRATTGILYTIIAWSFFMQLVGSLVNLGAWAQDISLYHYIALAPAVNPDWRQWAGLCIIGLVCAALGIIFFTRRDITTE